jgi:HSP20 family protein
MNLIRYQNPELMSWPSLDRWMSLRDDLNSVFESPFWSGFGRAGRLFSAWSPALDLYQNNGNVVAVVELPGMRKEDIEISLHDGTLTISGERRRETSNGEKTERTERYIGKFRRSITLPVRVDANRVSAKYQDGILTVTLPKAEEAKLTKLRCGAWCADQFLTQERKLSMNTLVRENRDGDRAQAEQFVAASASVIEAADGYTLQVEMPGVNKQGLEASVENNELVIVGRRSLPTVNGTLIHHELRPENYQRTFGLDPSIDAGRISAKIDQGLVTLTLP